MNLALRESGFQLAPLGPEVALGAYQLPGEFHADPAERLIVATARHLNATLITKDEKIRAYPHVRSLWD
jgi:PIN domain nuclease of toxin-antitoxin system